MSDLIFRCPSCKHPLAAEPLASGRMIQCPKCQVMIQVPLVRTGLLKSGRSPDGVTLRRQQERLRRMEAELREVEVLMEHQQRTLPAQQAHIGRMSEVAAIMKDQLELLSRQLELREAEAPAHPAEGDVPPHAHVQLWKWFTLICAGLAICIALLTLRR